VTGFFMPNIHLNSEVKRISGVSRSEGPSRARVSVGRAGYRFPHVRVAHRQASILLVRETKSP